jgi:glutathione-specific gamma-glutamylcyclotransferase
MRTTPGDLWVFGYGSLMWDPGFPVIESRRARLDGFHRGFCMRSIHHRGTPERPGLVLALERMAGAVCHGIAFRSPAAERTATLACLRARELVSAAYLEATVPVVLDDGAELRAVAFVMDTTHPQYCRLSLDEQAQAIAGACGGRGRNDAYLFNTVAHLHELGIPDPDLDALARLVAQRAGGGG